MPKAKVVRHKAIFKTTGVQTFRASCFCKWEDTLDVSGQSDLSVALATLSDRYKEHYAG